MLSPCFAIILIIVERNEVCIECVVLEIHLNKVESGMYYKYCIFSSVSTARLEEWAKNRMVHRRQGETSESHRFLIPQLSTVTWGENRVLDKHDIISEVIGDGVRPKMGKKNDASCMQNYLNRVDPSGLQDPGLTSWENFIPNKATLLDYLAVVTHEKDDNWRFPRLGLLREFQADRGLSLNLLQSCRVREIYCVPHCG